MTTLHATETRADANAEGSRIFLLPTGKVDAWVQVAREGEVLLYARQYVLPQKATIGEHVRLIAERGLVRHEPQRRCAADARLFEYRVRRTAKPVAGPAKRSVGPRDAAERLFSAAAIDAIGGDSAVLGRQILDLIADAAVAQEACPTERVLCAAIGAPLDRVRREMYRLREAGALVLEKRRGDFGLPRRVAILPSRGLMTAMRPCVAVPNRLLLAAAL